MTLTQFDALARVEQRANDESSGKRGNLPAPTKRNWGTAHDFKQWEARANHGR